MLHFTKNGNMMRQTPKNLMITTAVSLALLAGCNTAPDAEGEWAEENVAVCTDKDGKRVEDDKCSQSARQGGSMIPGIFAWYYLSRGARMPAFGAAAMGGSFKATPGASYRASASVMRGGLGSSARSSGSAGRGIGG
jgi:hypothetical protein